MTGLPSVASLSVLFISLISDCEISPKHLRSLCLGLRALDRSSLRSSLSFRFLVVHPPSPSMRLLSKKVVTALCYISRARPTPLIATPSLPVTAVSASLGTKANPILIDDDNDVN